MDSDLDILIAYGATTIKFRKGCTIFIEGNMPRYFFKLQQGEVKLVSVNSDGKEFIQGIFKDGDTFGEPPLFLNKPYPSSAIATMDSIVLSVSREKILTILDDFPHIGKALIYKFAARIYDKSTTAQILNAHSPEEKIMGFLIKLKLDSGNTAPYLIPYTRQQIADIIGLRVETVIRTLAKLNVANKVQIINHKLFY